MSKPSKTDVLIFSFGAVASLVGAAFAASKTAHKLAVRGVAGSLCMKDNALQKIETIREEAMDIYEEARRVPADEECSTES